jgi:DNA-binding MarR family transcriptional regulator
MNAKDEELGSAAANAAGAHGAIDRPVSADISTPAVGGRFVHRYLASVLALASHHISAEFHVQVKKAGLKVTEWRILASLYESDGETVGELAHLAITKQPTLSKVLPRLEEQGLVTLRTARADRRQTVVRITPKGTRLVAPLCEKAMAHQRQVLSKLDPGLAERLVEMLRTIITPDT